MSKVPNDSWQLAGADILIVEILPQGCKNARSQSLPTHLKYKFFCGLTLKLELDITKLRNKL